MTKRNRVGFAAVAAFVVVGMAVPGPGNYLNWLAREGFRAATWGVCWRSCTRSTTTACRSCSNPCALPPVCPRARRTTEARPEGAFEADRAQNTGQRALAAQFGVKMDFSPIR